MRDIILIAHDIRSCHNVGSLLRTAEGLGAKKVFLTGYTPYPLLANDPRMPHIARKLDAQIQKTALGAEKLVEWQHSKNVISILRELKQQYYEIIGLEQHKSSVLLPDYIPTDRVAVLLGREVEGIETKLLAECDRLVEIPMFGKKESYNVVQAAAMILSYVRFFKS